MGKVSKRSKVVTLAKTQRKDKRHKAKVFETARNLLQSFPHCFVLSMTGFKTAAFQKIREQWTDSKFLMGKTKVLKKAMGKTATDALLPNSHQLAKFLVGTACLLFTKRTVEEVSAFFHAFSEAGFLHAGEKAPEDVIIPAGTETFQHFSHSIEPYLRQLGLPTKLHEGQIHVLTTFTVCRAGETLSPEQRRVLKLLDQKLGEFHIQPKAVWNQDGTFAELPSS